MMSIGSVTIHSITITFPAMDADVRKALQYTQPKLTDRALEEIERAKIEITRMKEYLSQRLNNTVE